MSINKSFSCFTLQEVKVEIEEETSTSQAPPVLPGNTSKEEIHHYDPTKSQSQNSIVDPYESIKEPDVKKDQKVSAKWLSLKKLYDFLDLAA